MVVEWLRKKFGTTNYLPLEDPKQFRFLRAVAQGIRAKPWPNKERLEEILSEVEKRVIAIREAGGDSFALEQYVLTLGSLGECLNETQKAINGYQQDPLAQLLHLTGRAEEAQQFDPTFDPLSDDLIDRIMVNSAKYSHDLPGPDEADKLVVTTDYLAQLANYASVPHRNILYAFLDATDIAVSEDLSDYLGTVEVGGFLSFTESLSLPRLAGSIGDVQDKAIYLNLRQTSSGSENSIKVRGNYEAGDIGKWHTHPQLGVSIFSLADQNDLSSGFEMNLRPHLIIAPDSSRLYIPEFLADLTSDKLKRKLVKYDNEARKQELVTDCQGYTDRSQEITEVKPFCLYYLDFPTSG